MSLRDRAHSSRVNEIDLLRFIAALAVVAFHFGFELWPPGPAPVVRVAAVTAYGNLGVQLFFLISGFVILMTAAKTDVRGFIISRVVRLYPTFWLCCALTTVVVIASGAHISLRDFLANMTMIPKMLHVEPIDGAYWTLAVEMRFYVLVGVVLAVGWMPRIERLLLAWLGALLLLYVLPGGYVSAVLGQILIDTYGAFFVAGALMYLVWAQGVTATRMVAIAIAGALGITQTVRATPDGFFAQFTHYNLWIVGGLVALCFAAMLLVSLRRTGITHYRWETVGALTYPVYLIHERIGGLFVKSHAGTHPIWAMLEAAAGALLVAYLINRFFERPGAPIFKRALRAVLYWRPQPAAEQAL